MLDAAEVLRIGRTLRWPAASVHGRVIAGEVGWRAFIASCPPPTPGERGALARSLRRHVMVLTDVGRRRLRAWLDQQRATPSPIETPAERRQRIARELAYYGDPECFRPALDAVAGLPRPVGDHVVATSMVCLTGRSSLGWTGGLLPPNKFPIFVAALADEQIRSVVRHEAAHRWLLDDPVIPMATALEYSERRTAMHQVAPDALRALAIHSRGHEAECDWCAAAWS
jgi:hypothetical protein